MCEIFLNNRFFVIAGLLFMLYSAKGQTQVVNPAFDLHSHSFVENKGQFDNRLPSNPIRFGYEGIGQQIFLADNTIYFNLFTTERRVKTEEEKEQRALRKKQGFSSHEAFASFEKEGNRLKYTTDLLVAEWVGANPNVELISSGQDPFTHTYELKENKSVGTKSGIHSFQKVTYKNLYPDIDVEYTLHPESGVKYSLILHPGADLSQVKLRYSKNPRMLNNGSLATQTRFGDVLDHPPLTFYQNTNNIIPSAYVLNGNEISFSLGNYDHSQTVVIDPWTNLPNDPGSNWNSAWECETDALGNSYAIFGAMPLQLRKFNAAGAVQWTYNTTYDTTSWLGTFVTDDAGNSYVTNGSTAALRKVSPAGGLIWSVGNISGHLLGEFWSIAFNCDQTKLIVGGTGGFLNPVPYIYDINMGTGALLASLQVHLGGNLFNSQEVRGITATENAKYYWMSHDSIGFVSQSFANCPSPSSELIVNSSYNLGYKCENWRYNNTGIEALAYYGGFVYVNRGNRIDKRALATANIVASAAIPGGAFTGGFGGSYVENSGIVISNTGRIFVGSKGSVSQFDANLVLIGTYPVTGGYTVYDVDLTSTGQLIACGSTGTAATGGLRTGTVESLGILGTAPFAMTCCDASICNPGNFCDTDGPVALVPGTPGGVWTSGAPGFNPATGVFDPSVAGIGTYTFYYTLACGTDSLVVDVVFCPVLSVCVELNGDLTVSGGTPVYTWQTGTMVASCPFGPGAGCNFLTHAVQTLTWTFLANGVTITPPPGADTVRVFDATYSYTSWDISTLPPCGGVLPIELTFFEGEAVGVKTNSLKWVTSSEVENDHFTLHSSGNGTDWKVIGKVKGAGTTSEESIYSFIDREAHFPITYYKLGETDKNGLFQHLSTLAVYAEENENFVLNVHPVPANKSINFTYNGSGSGNNPLKVSTINSLGAVVMEKTYSGFAQNVELTLDVSALAEGVYILSFKQSGRSIQKKILIRRSN